MSAHACAEMLWSGYGKYPCKNAGKVERDGKWWCGVHDPERVKAKRAERTAKREVEWAASTKRQRLEHAAPALADALEALVIILDSKFVRVEVATKREADQLTEANEAATAALRAAGRLP